MTIIWFFLGNICYQWRKNCGLGNVCLYNRTEVIVAILFNTGIYVNIYELYQVEMYDDIRWTVQKLAIVDSHKKKLCLSHH